MHLQFLWFYELFKLSGVERLYGFKVILQSIYESLNFKTDLIFYWKWSWPDGFVREKMAETLSSQGNMRKKSGTFNFSRGIDLAMLRICKVESNYGFIKNTWFYQNGFCFFAGPPKPTGDNMQDILSNNMQLIRLRLQDNICWTRLITFSLAFWEFPLSGQPIHSLL